MEMDLNYNPAQNQYQKINNQNNFTNKLKNSSREDSEEQLKEVVDEFTSIFLNQMFKSMRSTIPEGGMIDGGFAEDVFTDMYDKEISKLGSKQNNFSGLNQILFEQLNQNSK
ncbi:MAG TPA: rod-binding protein [Halanaerobiales bacterium]|nr:rod-binding protein [Halanaerobiales bacterium]